MVHGERIGFAAVRHPEQPSQKAHVVYDATDNQADGV